ncbi:hypothetical protein HPP92_009245 [Vanilla planifolia]|uniref:Uncharacterized protein n=1 Tax=Vanilla planifolia TaxID=51239 RepID=A0A835V806_VANPL|nr:hypothetical protein HPP92_009245 [Vanilla planifolia]
MGGEQVARGGGLIYIIKWHGLFMMLANIIYDLGESWIKLAVEKQSMQFTVYILKKESLASVEDIDNRKKPINITNFKLVDVVNLAYLISYQIQMLLHGAQVEGLNDALYHNNLVEQNTYAPGVCGAFVKIESHVKRLDEDLNQFAEDLKQEGKIPPDEPAILPPLPIVSREEKRRGGYITPLSKRVREREWDRDRNMDLELMPPPGSHKKSVIVATDNDQPIDPDEQTYCVCHQKFLLDA